MNALNLIKQLMASGNPNAMIQNLAKTNPKIAQAIPVVEEIMKQMGYNLNNIDFYVVANMMYNDYYDLVKEDEELALKLSYMWLNDEDSVKDKLYEYYKHIPKED